MSKACFVFGSNLAGIHGKGAAKEALNNWGALFNKGHGAMNNCYAIPTIDEYLIPLPLYRIKEYITLFLNYVKSQPDTLFILTPAGCGLAGYTPEQIAPFFKEQLFSNIYYPKQFIECWIKESNDTIK